MIEENDIEKIIISCLYGNPHLEKRAVTVLHVSKQGSFKLIITLLELNISERKQKVFESCNSLLSPPVFSKTTSATFWDPVQFMRQDDDFPA